MTPADIYIELRRLLDIDDSEMLQAARSGAVTLVDGLKTDSPLVADIDDRDGAVEIMATVTASRLVAWRKRDRDMTWDELRVLIIGLRALMRVPSKP